MARTEARIRCAVWRNRDFTSLPLDAQGLYWMLLSQPDVSLAGVVPHNPTRWGHLTSSDTAGPLALLEDGGFVHVDRATGETWVRTFVRHDGVLQSPKTRAGMWSAWHNILSPTIRGRFVEALDGVTVTVKRDGKDVEIGVRDEAFDQGWATETEAERAISEARNTPPHTPSDRASLARADSDTNTDTNSDTFAPAKPTRNEIFDALVEASGWDPKSLTASGRGRANKAAKELDEIGATPEGIRARAAVHRSKWPDMSVTPTSIAANYAELGKPSSTKDPPPVRSYDERSAAERFAELTGQETA